MTIFRDLIAVFKKLQGFKYKNVLPNSRFRRLRNYKFMTNENYSKFEYDLLYKKIETSKEG